MGHIAFVFCRPRSNAPAECSTLRFTVYAAPTQLVSLVLCSETEYLIRTTP